MRIVIETSEGLQGVRLEPVAVGASDASDVELADGGAGPTSATTGTGGREGLPASDAGPPPTWLLDAVGAAEADGRQVPLAPQDDVDGTQVEDAGPGPVADPFSHVTSEEPPT